MEVVGGIVRVEAVDKGRLAAGLLSVWSLPGWSETRGAKETTWTHSLPTVSLCEVASAPGRRMWSDGGAVAYPWRRRKMTRNWRDGGGRGSGRSAAKVTCRGRAKAARWKGLKAAQANEGHVCSIKWSFGRSRRAELKWVADQPCDGSGAQ